MTAPNSNTNGHHDHVVDELVAACLDEADRFTRGVVERACDENPTEAESLRRRYDALRASGLVAAGPIDGPAPDPWSDGARAALSDPDAAKQFDPIGPYQPLKELGRGGQAVVFLAEDVRLHRPVALKVLKGLGPLSETVMNRFKREAEVASKLDHPGICAVYDAGVKDAVPYIAMRFVEGETLGDRIETAKEREHPERPDADSASALSVGSVTKSDIIRLLETIEKAARALHIAHEAGIVHRDVKPGNIMVTPGGEPVLLDFGLAGDEDGGLMTLTETGDMLGTPAYMSPEQLMAKRIRVDRRTDVYSLGVTLFECLTLERPFSAKTRDAMYQAIQFKDPTDVRSLNPALPPDLKVIVETALEKDRDQRYQTAEDFADDLRRLRTGEPIAARPVSALGRAWRWAKRRPMRAALAAALVIGVPLLTALLGHVIANRPAVIEAERQARLDEIEGHLEAGYEELAHGDPQVALASFDAALVMNAGSGEAIGGKTLALYRARDYEGCLAFLDQQGDVEGGVWALHRVRIDALRELGRDGEAADEEKKTTAEPKTALGFFLAGAQLMQDCRKHHDKDVFRRAHTYFQRAALTASHARRLYHYQVAHAAGHWEDEEAVSTASAALRQLWPDSNLSPVWAAWALRRAGRVEEAIDVHQELVALRPDDASAWCQLGNALQTAERHDEAIHAYEKALDLDPDDPAILASYANTLSQSGRADDGIAACRRALEIDPDHPLALGNLGVLLTKAGQLDAAIEKLRRATDLEPNHTSLANLGEALLDKGQVDDAIDAFNRAIRFRLAYPSAHDGLGRALMKRGRYEDAIAAHQKAIDLDPENAAIDYSNLAAALLGAGRVADAIEACHDSIDRDPGRSEPYNNLGMALSRLGKHEEAIDAYHKSIERGGGDAITHSNLGTALRDAGRIDEAIASAKKAVELRPDYGLGWAHLGYSLLLANKVDDALAACKRAVDSRPDLPLAWNNLGSALVREGRVGDAIDAHLKAVRLGPKLAYTHSNLGYAYLTARRFRDAVDSYKTVLALDATVNTIAARNNLGMALMSMRRYVRAITVFRDAVALKPEFATGWNNLALACSRAGRADDALDAYQEAVRVAPDFAKGWENLATMLSRRGRVDEAIGAYRKWVELKPTHGGWRSLGAALTEAGKFEDAIAAYRESIALVPKCAPCHLDVGDAQRGAGRLDDAATSYRKALEISPKFNVARNRLDETEKLRALGPKLRLVLAGTIEPADAEEAYRLARLARYRRLYAGAARLWAQNFERYAQPAGKDTWWHRYFAARPAILAAAGKGEDAETIDAAERAAWRKRALGWLREQLVTAGNAMREKKLPADAVEASLRYWRRDYHLASVRDKALERLPAAERTAWTAFWVDVDALIEQAAKQQ